MLESRPGRLDVVATGVVASDATNPLEQRLRQIYDGVTSLLAEHAPSTVVIEDLYAEYRFPRTALQMAHARGVICLAVAPAAVKRAITANGAASKSQVQENVRRHLRLPALPRPSHVADALGLALTGFWRLGGRLP